VRRGRPTTSLHGLAVELCEGDVLAPETLAAAMRGVEVVFHTATYFAYGRPAGGALEALAVDGAANVLRAAAAAGVRRVVLTSSSVVFGYGDEPGGAGRDLRARRERRGRLCVAKIRPGPGRRSAGGRAGAGDRVRLPDLVDRAASADPGALERDHHQLPGRSRCG
jgi:hypothetical protein